MSFSITVTSYDTNKCFFLMHEWKSLLFLSWRRRKTMTFPFIYNFSVHGEISICIAVGKADFSSPGYFNAPKNSNIAGFPVYISILRILACQDSR